jgi:integrase
MEQTAVRVGELRSLECGDVDIAGSQFRLRAGKTKTKRARWVQVPAWLMDEIAATCPLEDRTAGRRVFPGFTPDLAKNVMARACKAAGIAHFHPHDFRHRRASLWHGQGVTAKELAGRIGHARASMSLDVYSHVMPLDEVPTERFSALIGR